MKQTTFFSCYLLYEVGCMRYEVRKKQKISIGNKKSLFFVLGSSCQLLVRWLVVRWLDGINLYLTKFRFLIKPLTYNLLLSALTFGLSAFYFPLLAFSFLLITYNLQPTTYNLQLITYYLQLITYNPALTNPTPVVSNFLYFLLLWHPEQFCGCLQAIVWHHIQFHPSLYILLRLHEWVHYFRLFG